MKLALEAYHTFDQILHVSSPGGKTFEWFRGQLLGQGATLGVMQKKGSRALLLRRLQLMCMFRGFLGSRLDLVCLGI